ncbi:MAG: hypothetical protein PHO10_05165 [Gemmiger sp.]|nr:hypothetical protein [Gemmiger sp.]
MNMENPNPNQNEANGAQTPPTYTQQPPRKVRRVGTFTLGLVLVMAGVLLTAKILMPNFDLGLVLRFSPLVLITLGVEVLVYATRPDVTLKYDFLSIFVCFLVICGAACSGVAVQLARYYTPDRNYAQQHLARQLEDASYTALQPQSGLIRDLGANVWLRQPVDVGTVSALALADLTAEDDVQLNITMLNQYPSAAAFAADCKTILDAAVAAGLPVTHYYFDTWMEEIYDGGTSYQLDIDGPWLKNADAARLAANTSASWWWQGSSYDTEAAREQAIRQATAESAEPADDSAYEEQYRTGYEDGYMAAQNDSASDTSITITPLS